MLKLFLLFMSLVPLHALAQEQDSLNFTHKKTDTSSVKNSYPKIRYHSTSLSLPYRAFRDEGQSPLFYRGQSIQLSTYNERWRKKTMTKLEVIAGIGSLKTSKKNVSVRTSASVLTMELNYHYMRPIRKILHGKGDWYLGGILTNTFDGRLYASLQNNSFGYEFSTVINPASHITYNFTLGKNQRKYQAGFKLNFALLAHVLRPNYIGMEPYQTYAGETIKPFAIFTHGNKIVLPNRFIRVNTEIYLDRFAQNSKNKVRIYYGWGLHVTKLPQSNPLYAIYHSIGFVKMIYSEKQKKSSNPTLPR